MGEAEDYDAAGAILDGVISHVETCEWNVDAIELQPVFEALGLKAGKFMHVVYTAIEGRSSGLPLFDAIHARS